VEEYIAAFLRADVEGIKRLLADDVLMEMPPMTNWFTGPANYGVFMEWVFEKAPGPWRALPISANGQPGFAAYHRDGDGTFRMHTLHVFTVGPAGIVRNTVWVDEDVWDLFGLERTLPA
jgi:RNA polymerase sigma-70 factor (ECF subfamily)